MVAVPQSSSSRLSLTDQHFVLLFHTTHETMHAESILKRHRMRFKLVPRPRDIQDDCGLGLVIVKEDRQKTEALLPPEGIYIKAAFHIGKEGQWTRENYPPAPISYDSPPSE
jgi:CTP synthase (UTP-ammonia lyase)